MIRVRGDYLGRDWRARFPRDYLAGRFWGVRSGSGLRLSLLDQSAGPPDRQGILLVRIGASRLKPQIVQ